ncbi:MAG TPA: class I SAM-dependent methyltransferase [Solirubrobacteraceae bacterium]|jgi:ubiquinone/menaquinone biosynthesis C-methylase UbiE|nr:class I SAM-dependent methyltransferase [Solirubrobacteraceae bacterium]
MSLWGRVFAAMYDRVLADTERAGLAERRRALLSQAHGAVLEIGAGTGANLDKYPGTVTDLVLLEPEPPMARRLADHLSRASVPARIVSAPAESIPFADDTFDFAVSTLVLCTVNDPARALSELKRVLRPGGRLLFLEHVRSEDPGVARWQDRIHPLWLRIGHGCHCNRSTLELIGAGGFSIEGVEHGRMPKAPPFVRPMIDGSASA